MNRTPTFLNCAAAGAAGLLLVACSNPGTRARPQPVVGQVAETLDEPDGLGRGGRAALAREDLLRAFRADPAGAVQQLHSRWAGDLTEPRRAELAEIASAAAGRLEKRDSDAAAGLRLTAAELTWPLAIARQTTDERRTGRAIYNHHCGTLAERLHPAIRAGSRSSTIRGPLRSYQLRTVSTGAKRIDPARFDTLVRSDRLEMQKLDFERHRVEGIGADLVAHRAWTAERAAKNPLHPRTGLAMPLNAMLDFSGPAGQPKLVFHDMTLATEVRAGGRDLPLSSDITAAVASFIEHADVNTALFGFKDMLRSADYEETTGLYQAEPWRNDQVPVILVHGLMSSPATWLTVLNELQADPVLQARYQFFAYRYQTGYPIGLNAAKFRRQLQAFKRQVDPGGNNPRFRRMVLIGHSMGGILSNLQVRSSGEKIRKLIYERELDEIDMSPEQRRDTAELVYFEPNPNVRRAVFMAAPHRGSEIASNPLGRFGSRLIELPMDIMTLGMSRRESLDGTTSLGRQVRSQGVDSIKALQPENPLLAMSPELPVGRGVTIHSVIGNRIGEEPVTESSDGVVDYWSSHLDNATSEKVVRASHVTITHDPEAIEELRRILYLHEGLRYTPRNRE